MDQQNNSRWWRLKESLSIRIKSKYKKRKKSELKKKVFQSLLCVSLDCLPLTILSSLSLKEVINIKKEAKKKIIFSSSSFVKYRSNSSPLQTSNTSPLLASSPTLFNLPPLSNSQTPTSLPHTFTPSAFTSHWRRNQSSPHNNTYHQSISLPPKNSLLRR